MQYRDRQIPEGMRDTLPAQCAAKRALERGLCDGFARAGYREVETPLLERYDTFAGGIDQRLMWKTTGRDGRILAVRPDNTTPVVRMAATLLGDAPLPLRLSYVQEVVEFPLGEHPRDCQSAQAGIELLGEASPDADAEVIALAIEALEKSGLKEFQIDIGQVDFFKGMMEESGLTAAEQERLRAYVEQKSMLDMALMLRNIEAGEGISRRIMQLPALYGGEEALSAARQITKSPRALAALARIEQVLAALNDYGVARYVSIDLGMVHAIDYYTGIIFRGMTAHLGRPLLSGGRYDSLPVTFGRPLNAIGFGLNVEQLMIALERQGDATPAAQPALWIGYAPSARAAAVRMAQTLRAQGETVAMCYAADEQALQDTAWQQGARRALYIDQGGAEREVRL